MNRAAIVVEARSWLGTRYQHQASVKGVGADCIGFVGGVAMALGLPEALAWASDPACKGYARTPDARVLLAACSRYLDAIPIASAVPGDVLVFRFEQEPQHFSLLVAPGRIIHSYAPARKVAEMGIDGEWRTGIPWRALIVSAWSFRGLNG